MLTTSANLWLGLVFVLVGGVNVWLIMQSSARVRDTKASTRLIAAHRIGGYVFIALFCIMGYFMLTRLGDADGGAMLHMTLAMVLSPLLFVKVIVARYYRSYHSVLLPLGLTIFVLSFVLIGIAAGPGLAHRVQAETAVEATANAEARLMEKRCSKCHNLDRIESARKDAPGWLATVNRMTALPNSGISEPEARIIVSWLTSQMTPKGPAAAANLEVARAIVDQRCGRCHSLDRVYKTTKSPDEWKATVDEMAGYAAGSANAFQPGEQAQMAAYLATTQTPEAASQRKAAGTTVAQPATKPSAPGSPDDFRVPVVIGFVALGTGALAVRRPKAVVRATTPVSAVVPPSGGPMILRLAAITQQASDAKTLRFVVPDGRKLVARPGQFLTFSFLFDGKKVNRSYSICSSAARTGYVEITAKRAAGGNVSAFLNERVAVGMTVEASGPFGQFFFDESRHRDIVLLAAGSGITPMIAMLRYIDDLCLDTRVTLLYCVRSRNDVILEAELQQLQGRLSGFKYHLMLSRAEVNGDCIRSKAGDVASKDCFMCGPAGFMDSCRDALVSLGVSPERIFQESFGAASSGAAGVEAVAEFARSGKTCTVRAGQTLLSAAEENGVPIPSSCRRGQCGTCKTRLLSGQVTMDAEAGLDPASKAAGYVLTCVGHAEGAVKLDA